MAIIRTEKNKNYTVMSNMALNDNSLSLKAKGLWAFIMSKPDTWSINGRGLAEQLKESRPVINKILKELEDAKYLVRGVTREKGGKFTTGDSTLYEQPWTKNPSTVKLSTKVSTVNKVNTNTTKVVGKKENQNPDAIYFGGSSRQPTAVPPHPLGSRAATPTGSLYYQVIKKYQLVVTNHTNVKKWIKDLEESVGIEIASLYLQRLLERDIREEREANQFVPTLNTPFDICNKSSQIISYFKSTKDKNIPRIDSTEYYKRQEEEAKRAREA